MTTTLAQIFRFRDEAVHPPETFVTPSKHPIFGYGMDPRLIRFRSENARESYRFAHQLIWFCLHKPKAKWAALATWCETAKDLIEEPQD